MKISPGTLLNQRYLIQKELGEGGFAVVYKAIDKELEREVAIKILKPFAASETELQARFKREARYLGQLNCENIVSIFAFGLIENRQPFICMEYIQGRSLKKLIEIEGPPDRKLLKSILEQVCRGLLHAHDNGLVHRDLSPSNILIAGLGANARAKILDFGLSRLYETDSAEQEKLTGTGMLLGNPPYMSPEQASGHKPDKRSDIYSLGCTLYECLSRKPPFEADTPLGVLYMQQNCYPQEPALRWEDKEEEELFKYITLRCLQKSPEKRFQSCSEILGILESRKLPDYAGLNAWETGKTTQDRSAVKAALITVVIAAFFLAATFFVGTHRQKKQYLQLSEARRSVAATPAMQLSNLTDQMKSQSYGARSTEKLNSITSQLKELIPKLNKSPSKQFVAYILLADAYQSMGDYPGGSDAAQSALALCKTKDGNYFAEATEALWRLTLFARAMQDHNATKNYGVKTLELIDKLRANPASPSLGVPSLQFGMNRMINTDGRVCQILQDEAARDNDKEAGDKWARRAILADEFRINLTDSASAVAHAETFWRLGAHDRALENLATIRKAALDGDSTPESETKEGRHNRIAACVNTANWYAEHKMRGLEKEALLEAKELCKQFKLLKEDPYPEIIERLKN